MAVVGMRRHKKWLSAAVLTFGGSLFIYGLFLFERYNFTPGEQIPAPIRWPVGQAMEWRDSSVPTLLVFVHPRCACTRATLAELNKIRSLLGNRLHTEVILKASNGDDAEVIERAEARVREIVALSPHRDLDGVLTRAFGAKTSGQTMLYGADGTLLFQGGITPSRGHEGDNQGEREIVRLVNAPVTQAASTALATPTFGCKL